MAKVMYGPGCAVRTTKLVNGYFFAILSATPTSAATKILLVCHGCGTADSWIDQLMSGSSLEGKAFLVKPQNSELRFSTSGKFAAQNPDL